MFKSLFNKKPSYETLSIIVESISEEFLTYRIKGGGPTKDLNIRTEMDKIPEVCPIKSVPVALRTLLVPGATAFLQKNKKSERIVFEKKDLY